MPAPKTYHGDRPATPAERQRAYNERKRQEERDRLAAEAAERQRVQDMKDATLRATGKALRKLHAQHGIAGLLGWDRGDPEAVAYLNQLIYHLEQGKRYLP